MSHTQHVIPQVARLIPLGRLVATPHALALLEKAKLSTFALFARQERGDWGDVDIEDAMANEQALIYGGRLMSVISWRSERFGQLPKRIGLQRRCCCQRIIKARYK